MPTDDLNICIPAFDIIPHDVEANLRAFDTFMERLTAPGSDSCPAPDLIVLPELFNSGFTPDPEVTARITEDPADSPTLRRIGQWAARSGAAIAGSFTAMEQGRPVNRAFIVDASGRLAARYDKHHLFLLGGEADTYTAGRKPSEVATVKGWRIALAVCYDIRFPAWCRNRGQAYDCLVVPASWPTSRAYAWRQLLIARAIENQACVVGANRIGADEGGTYDISAIHIIDDRGTDCATVTANPPAVRATLSARQLDADRRRFPVWRDADSFSFD